MIFQYLDYPEFQAFRRLITIRKQQGKLNRSEMEYITFMATEHGISRDQVRELVEMCEVDASI